MPGFDSFKVREKPDADLMQENRPLDTFALLQRLHASGVEFVIIGGVAAIS
jgi:hypothetical protein